MLPPAIIFVNSDSSTNVQQYMSNQLYVSEIITGAEFDKRVELDPNYPLDIHLKNIRIIVVRPFNDYNNRNLCDVAIFINRGLAVIEFNKYGPPNRTYRIETLSIYQLLSKPWTSV